MRSQFIFSGLLLLGGMLSVDVLSAEETLRSETVVVTATADKTSVVTGEVDQVFNTGFSQTISRDEFDNRVTTLAEALDKQSSIQVRSSGGFGSFSSMTLRGASSQQVLVFIDGMLLNDAAVGGVDLSTISLSDVENIEVYRGATPMSLGSASIGGAINIRTLKASGNDRGNITFGYGDFNTQKYSAFFSSKPSDWDYVISAERFSSDNNFEFINNNGTRLNPDDDRVERRNNNAFDQASLLLKMGHDIDTERRFDLLVQWLDKQKQIPVRSNHPAADTRYGVERSQSQLRYISDNVGPYALNLSNTIEYLETIEEYDDRMSSVGLGAQHDKNTTTVIKIRSFTEVPLDTQLLSFIIEVSDETYKPSDLLNNRINFNSSRQSAMLGIEDKFFLLDDKLLLNAAISETRSRDTLAHVDMLGALSPVIEVEREHTEPRVGLKYFSNDWLTLKINLGRYVRQPLFYELLGDRGYIIGNPDLKNETGKNFDIGFDVFLLPQFEFIDRLSWQFSLFYSDVEDIIVRTYNAQGVGKSENVNKAQISGIENILRVELLNKLNFNFSSTIQEMVNEQKNPALKNSQLPGRFKWNYNARIDYTAGAFSPFIEHSYQSGMYYDKANLLKAANKNIINAGISWQMHPATITLDLHNFTDEFYEDFRGFPQPGRAIFTTFKLDL